MIYHIGDKVHVESTKKVGDGVVSNIKYDAVRNDYELDAGKPTSLDVG